jgi:formate hydrogenlyase transcriptional activator
LGQWHWPGNIRELENFMERSVILTDGSSLRVPVDELAAILQDRISEPQPNPGGIGSQGTLEELERQYIVQVLRQAAGVVSGSHGAAARLGMKRTTLQSKMQRLRITREEYAS